VSPTVYSFVLRFCSAAVPQPSSAAGSGGGRRGSESRRSGRGGGPTTAAHPTTAAATVPFAAATAAGRGGRWTGGRCVGTGRDAGRRRRGRGHVRASGHDGHDAVHHQPARTLHDRR